MDFVKINANASLPIRQTPDAAGYDLHSMVHASVGAVEVIPTGVAVKIPAGHVGLIRDRSGLAAKHGLTVLAGVIDADYTGEIKVVLSCTKIDAVAVSAGERIAQLVIVPCVMETSQWVVSLDETERGAGGFGSTGAQ